MKQYIVNGVVLFALSFLIWQVEYSSFFTQVIGLAWQISTGVFGLLCLFLGDPNEKN